MRLVQVTETTCCKAIQCSICYRLVWPVWADLDGPAFRAYYCERCKPKEDSRHENLHLVCMAQSDA